MRFRSPLLSQSRFLSFPPGTEMVHFPGFARARLWIHRAVRGVCPRGFPHSEISGSMPACGSPKLIAACHVLHRLLLPRHPPCALSSLTTKFTRHTQDRSQLSAISFQLKTKSNTPLKLYGPLWLLIAHTRLLNAMRTSSFSQALIKIYNALYLPNLFSCQISSSGEASLVVSRWPLAKNQNLRLSSCPLVRVWVLLSPGCANPLLPPTQCSAPGDFH
jgi:hypothetical protein